MRNLLTSIVDKIKNINFSEIKDYIIVKYIYFKYLFVEVFWSNLDIVRKLLFSFGFIILLILVLTGCSRGKVTDGENRIILANELAKFDLAKTQILSMKADTDKFMVQRTEPKVPTVSNLSNLKTYLSNNDCRVNKVEDETYFSKCYRKTVIELINANNELDKSTDDIYALKYTNFRLTNTLEFIFKSLSTDSINSLQKK